jgi:predicted ribosome quality control (RQC) complex YloA/Tae2 family protein
MAQKTNKTANGNMNILTQDQEQMRMQVVDLELKARYWEAQWKIRFYTLESEKMQPEYNEFLEREKEKQEAALKRFQEQIDAMNRAAQEKQEGDVTKENKEFLEALDTPAEAQVIDMRADYPSNR